MNLFQEFKQNITRRHFFQIGSHAVGWAALSSLLSERASAATQAPGGGAHFPAKAKQVIYLHMVGGPAQMDLWDYKPKMKDYFDKDLPDSVRMGQRLTTMTSGQARFPIAPSKFKFKQWGKCGMWVSELLPWKAKMVDDMCFIRSMHTEAINHEPAITYIQTGNQVTGRPCLGAWASYGLGSLNSNLPTFVVLVAQPTNTEQVQAISARLWSAGYLSGEHAGVSFRSKGDPILYINNPAGVPLDVRRKTLDGLKALNEMNFKAIGDPETNTRIQQYEMAFRMQASVPELTDISKEPEATFKLYGDEAKKPGTFANTALLARRLVERGVRFVQVYHNNWDTHANAAGRLPDQCRDVDQPCYGLIQDLKRRGMLDSTLVIWGGEFGRTIYSQGGLTKDNYGRDHHPRCFTMWLAGGGARPGTIYGETDDFSYNIIKDPVHIRDFHATVLHLLGFDHQRFTYRHQGLDQRLTGVETARVIKELLAYSSLRNMRIAILSAGDGWHVRDLQRSACVLGLEAAVVDFRKISASVSAAFDSLSGFDAVLVRTMPPGSLEQVVFRMDVLHRLQTRGVKVLNPPAAVEACVDKYLATAKLQAAGLRVPATIVCQHADAALEAFTSLGGDVVVKPMFGSEGRGMIRLADPDLAWRTFRTLERLQSVLYLQEFIAHPGWDLRVFVLGGRAIAGMRRHALGGWRTNVAQGGRAECVPVSSAEEQLAARSAAAVGAPMAGVDLLPGPDGEWYVLEVNAVPGWRALAPVSGVDVARAILDFLTLQESSL